VFVLHPRLGQGTWRNPSTTSTSDSKYSSSERQREQCTRWELYCRPPTIKTATGVPCVCVEYPFSWLLAASTWKEARVN